MKMQKITIKATFNRNPSIVHTIERDAVNESVEEVIFRLNRTDTFNTYEVVAVRDMTPAEIAAFNAENAAAEYYAKYGTMGEF